MLIVGELINASRKKVGEMIRARDTLGIQKIAKEQVGNGANYIDVNAGIFVDKEPTYLKWLVETVQAAVDTPCCIDSPNPVAIEAALSVHRGEAMINSISLEKSRYEALLSLVSGTNSRVVALCMSDDGMPITPEDRISIADTLINGLTQKNVPMKDIYVDPLVQPISTDPQAGKSFLKTVKKIMTTYDGVHTICGLSNISYGLPLRKLLNESFIIMSIAHGLDAAIIDPLNKSMMAAVISTDALSGRDEFCMNYLNAYREDRLDKQH
ncbi:methyltetrahydrofolate cobalamin methyltransferase [Desulfosarcina variabilis]|uniref:methyltetrahydrofolate cobalamin methyltransferase n=1 Tax=Desulfosarcina variabilis TaxID=2300 RepID=UPI003AFB528E